MFNNMNNIKIGDVVKLKNHLLDHSIYIYFLNKYKNKVFLIIDNDKVSCNEHYLMFHDGKMINKIYRSYFERIC